MLPRWRGRRGWTSPCCRRPSARNGIRSLNWTTWLARCGIRSTATSTRAQLTQAFAQRPRALGATIQRCTRVTGLAREPGRRMARRPRRRARSSAEIVVNAAGYRAGEVMALLGETLPTVTMSHQYLVTEPIAELAGRDEKLPLLRDPDASWYLRQERGGLLLGPYEWQATPHWLDGMPDEFASQLCPDDLDRLGPYIEDAIARVPIARLGRRAARDQWPDPLFAGRQPLYRPGARLCAISSTATRSASASPRPAAPARRWRNGCRRRAGMGSLGPRSAPLYRLRRPRPIPSRKAIELYQNEYAAAFPSRNAPPVARRARRRSMTRSQPKARQFCARGGWERAAWFARRGDDPARRPSFRRARHALVRRRRRGVPAVRERVGICDLGGFTKIDGQRPRCRGVARPHGLRPPAPRRPRRADLEPERARRHRQRVHGHPPRRRPLLPALRRRGRMARPRLARAASAGRRLGAARGFLRPVRHVGARRPASARCSGRRHQRRPVQQRLSLDVGARDRDRFRPGAGAARQLCRRIRLGAARRRSSNWRRSTTRCGEAGAAHGIADFGVYAMDSLRLEKCYPRLEIRPDRGDIPQSPPVSVGWSISANPIFSAARR